MVQIVIKVRHLIAAMLAAFAAGARYGFAALDSAWNVAMDALVKILRMFGH